MLRYISSPRVHVLRIFLNTFPTATLLLFMLACERPPLTRDAALSEAGDGGVESQGDVIYPNMEGYINDLYALGHKWYQHESGVLSAKDQVYLIRDTDQNPTAYYKFEVLSYYDVRGNSGHFSIAAASWNGSAWGDSQEMTLSASVKTGPPICVDLAQMQEVDCAGDSWQLNFGISQYLSPEILYALTINPTIYVRSTAGQPDRGGVMVAMLPAASLADVDRDPTTISDLPDRAAADLSQLLDYEHAAWSANIPVEGMVIGRAWAQQDSRQDHVYFLRGIDHQFSKFSLHRDSATADHVTIHYQSALDDEGAVALGAAPELDVSVPIPAAYGLSYVDFSAENPLMQLEGDLLHAPASTRDWDLAFESTSAGLQVLVSPAALIWDFSANNNGNTDYANAMPPLYDAE